MKPLAETMRDERMAQIWAFDDLSASGSPEKFKEWYKKRNEMESSMATFPNQVNVTSSVKTEIFLVSSRKR